MADGAPPVQAPGPRRGGQLTILASVQLPGVQLWVVGDTHSAETLVRMLTGDHLVLTLPQVVDIFRSSQRRVIVPQLAMRES